jgi:TolB protein
MLRPRLVILAATAMTLFGLAAVAGPAQAKAPGPNGQIAFTRLDPTICRDCSSTYTVNPDGTHQKLLLRSTGTPSWSPDGTEISVLADCSFGGPCSAVIVNPGTGAVRTLPNPNPALYNEFFACTRWSPDGARLTCDVVSDTPGFTGLYTIRSSDGGDLTKVLSCSSECAATDWSPDGKRLVIDLPDPNGLPALFVVGLNGTGLRQITPSGMDVDLEDVTASWSPSGNQIVFGGHTDPGHRRSIFVVNADGSGFHQVAIPGCGGAFSDPGSLACFDPGWSPDGTKIVFARGSGNLGGPSELNSEAIYTVSADGTGLTQVTTATNLDVNSPDWGPHPLAP